MSQSPNIWHFNPFDTQKRIGYSHNKHCRLIQDPEDWIVITDGDACYLTSDYGNLIEEATKSDFDIMGCLTNRIGVPHLRVEPEISNNPDIRYHIDIAKTRKFDNDILETNLVAGFFLLFKKGTYDVIGGFPDNAIDFDIQFCNKALELGFKIGVIQSIYMLHIYRWGKPLPRYYTDHLS